MVIKAWVNFFRKLNRLAAKTGESVVPLTDVDYYTEQIHNISGESLESARQIALAVAEAEKRSQQKAFASYKYVQCSVCDAFLFYRLSSGSLAVYRSSARTDKNGNYIINKVGYYRNGFFEFSSRRTAPGKKKDYPCTRHPSIKQIDLTTGTWITVNASRNCKRTKMTSAWIRLFTAIRDSEFDKVLTETLTK